MCEGVGELAWGDRVGIWLRVGCGVDSIGCGAGLQCLFQPDAPADVAGTAHSWEDKTAHREPGQQRTQPEGRVEFPPWGGHLVYAAV